MASRPEDLIEMSSSKKMSRLSNPRHEDVHNIESTPFDVSSVDSYEKMLELSKVNPDVANIMTDTEMTGTELGRRLVDSYEKMLALSKVNPDVADNMTRTSLGVRLVDSYEKMLELSKVNPKVAKNMTDTEFGCDLIDSHEKILELSKVYPDVANNMTRTLEEVSELNLLLEQIDSEVAKTDSKNVHRWFRDDLVDSDCSSRASHHSPAARSY